MVWGKEQVRIIHRQLQMTGENWKYFAKIRNIQMTASKWTQVKKKAD